MPTTPLRAPRPASRRVRSRETIPFMPLDCIDPAGLRYRNISAFLECVPGPQRALLPYPPLCYHLPHPPANTQRRRCRNDAHRTTWLPQRRSCRYPAFVAVAAADDRGGVVETCGADGTREL